MLRNFLSIVSEGGLTLTSEMITPSYCVLN